YKECVKISVLRGHARSHRYCTAFKACVVPVEAGKLAKGPLQAYCCGGCCAALRLQSSSRL
ncbi:hypothetical protein E4195_16935, partial [Pseudomonas putida]